MSIHCCFREFISRSWQKWCVGFFQWNKKTLTSEYPSLPSFMLGALLIIIQHSKILFFEVFSPYFRYSRQKPFYYIQKCTEWNAKKVFTIHQLHGPIELYDCQTILIYYWIDELLKMEGEHGNRYLATSSPWTERSQLQPANVRISCWMGNISQNLL